LDYEKRLTAEENILLKLIANGVGGKDNLRKIGEEALNNADWNLVFNEAKGQAVLLFAFDSVKNNEKFIPEEIYEEWFSYAAGVITCNLRIMNTQAELVELLSKNGIDYLILKGCASAEYYLKHDLRSLGDIDFLIKRNERDEVAKLLEANGYERQKEENECHTVFIRNGIHVEMHHEISGVPFGEQGETVKKFMDGAFDFPKTVTMEFGEFKAPSEEYHGLVLLLHMQHHMLGEGLGIRHLCDWARFISKTNEMPFWKEKLIPLLKKIGLYVYAKAITKTCSKYFESPLPEWAADVDEELCFEVVLDVIKSGNFGRKDKARANGGALVSEHGKAGTKHGKLYNAFKFTHRVVVLKYPFVKKVFILYPFLYAYKIVKYLALRLIGKRPSISKTITLATERKAVYDKLHVFETDQD